MIIIYLVNVLNELTEAVLKKLFTQISFRNGFNITGDSNWEVCKRILTDCTLTKTFKPIGNISLNLDMLKNQVKYYKVFGRYSLSKDNNEVYEFIFNDISRTKMEEKLNAEFKYKTVFLSKVAHEFKNPLLCITELVDQVNDIINNTIYSKNENMLKLKEILLSIKSMSDFLIILIKDMDFFSQKTNKKSLKLDIEKVKVSSLVTFCQNITETLIKKYHKDRLRFISGEENFPDYIYTDEVKLKQILVNLLSNSVKFSNTGYVKLKLNYNNLSEDMDFIVEDTGKGIAPEQKEKLFKPFVEDIGRTSNPVGAGLVSYIVKELVGLFDGGELQYESEVGKGTTFLFKSNIKGEYTQSRPQSPINHLSTLNKEIQMLALILYT
jgi:signal transduction histidine kinase